MVPLMSDDVLICIFPEKKLDWGKIYPLKKEVIVVATLEYNHPWGQY